jgi:hypothetical protein
MPAVQKPLHKKGDFLVDYEEKVFEDVKAKPGEKALVTFHTVAFEGSIGFVNLLQATRLLLLSTCERLIALGVYPFVVPFVPISGAPLEDYPAPHPLLMRRILQPLGAMLRWRRLPAVRD